MTPDWRHLLTGVSSHSPAETTAWAATLAQALPPDTVLALQGSLGSGKTTFVRGLARAWGIVQPITSPTFTIYNLYQGSSRLLLHLDAYRLSGPADLDALLLDDFLVSPWTLAIEWPGLFPSPWLDHAWWLHLHPGPLPESRLLALRLPPSLLPA